ncbi:MAG: GAF domain-containing protein [Proteobacteria bacterium]|nr:MAG: GAF domain-containing protein [Pseudomonadota bacterium]
MNAITEEQRIASLRSLEILDTLPEKTYDDLVKLARAVCGTSISAISLIDDDRQWFKSIVGLDVRETSREVAFCAHTIKSDELLLVNDALEDERFKNNPLVKGNPNIRFYAGAPLIFSDGSRLGALCVIDTKPHSLTKLQQDALNIIARQVTAHFELLNVVKNLKNKEIELKEHESLVNVINHSLPGVIYRAVQLNNSAFRFQYMSKGAERLFGLTIDQILKGPPFSDQSVHASERRSFIEALESSIRKQSIFRWEGRIRTSRQTQNWIRVTAMPATNEKEVVWYGIILDINQEKDYQSEITGQREKIAEASKVVSVARLASSLAREISNPLSIVKGFASYLRKPDREISTLAGSELDLLNAVISSVDRIDEVVVYLEQISKAEVSESFTSFRLSQIFADVFALAKTKIDGVNLEILLSTPDVHLARCRPIAITQAIHELILNACETLYKKSPKLTIEVIISNGISRITFQDSGCGISTDDSPFIFDPFFTTKNSGAARGLGLSRARVLIEEQGGTLTYDSSRFSTTFVLTLPHASLWGQG